MSFARNHLIASLPVLLLVAGLAAAQNFDPLEAARQQLKLQAQKLKADIDANFKDADRFEKSNPDKAGELLRRSKLLLEESNGILPEVQRKDLLQQIELRFVRLNMAVEKIKADREKRRQEIEKEIAELERKIAKLKAELGKMPAKPIVPLPVLPPNPNRPLPPKALLPAPLPARDILLMKALASTIKFSVKGQPLQDVLDFLEEKTRGDLTIAVDEQGLKEAKIDPAKVLKQPVTLEFPKAVKVRVILRKLLSERGMGYYIDDGVLIVTKDARASSKMVVKLYPVANLVGGQQLIDAARKDPKGQNAKQLTNNVDGLMAQIMGNVGPDYWKVSGKGPGTMTFVPASASLEIHASLEVHYLLLASGSLKND